MHSKNWKNIDIQMFDRYRFFTHLPIKSKNTKSKHLLAFFESLTCFSWDLKPIFRVCQLVHIEKLLQNVLVFKCHVDNCKKYNIWWLYPPEYENDTLYEDETFNIISPMEHLSHGQIWNTRVEHRLYKCHFNFLTKICTNTM